MKLFQVECRAALKLCEGLQTTRALTVKLLLEAGEYRQLAELRCDPLHYLETDAERFRDDYLVTDLLRKNPRLPLPEVDRRATALGKFLKAEVVCGETNARMASLINDPSSVRIITEIQDVLWSILGADHAKVSPSRADLDYAERHFQFGPGSTTTVKGDVRYAKKYNNRTIECTPSLVDYRAFSFPALWGGNTAPNITIRGSSRYSTVPKTALTDRSICIEPDLNIFVQKGIGALIRRKLKCFGLNLDCQDEVNGFMASRALDWDLATIDLSSASDTISESIVRLLLPRNWVQLLEIARTPAVTMPNGETLQLRKWSSMGNGYTFELESLIFLATVLSVVPRDEWPMCAAYGDDIICPRSWSNAVIERLEFLGFQLNLDKTFSTGLFYESCGSDWFNGLPVRPIYFRSKGNDPIQSIYSMANALRRHSNRGAYCDVRYLPAYLSIRNAVDKRDQHPIPPGFGDVGFEESWDRSQSSSRVKVFNNQDYQRLEYTFCYRRRKPMSRVDEAGGYLAALNRQMSPFSFGEEAIRGRLHPATTARGYSHEWPHLGEWR